jgi:hypothetical protein
MNNMYVTTGSDGSLRARASSMQALGATVGSWEDFQCQ